MNEFEDLSEQDSYADGFHVTATRGDAGSFITSFAERYRLNIREAMTAISQAEELVTAGWSDKSPFTSENLKRASLYSARFKLSMSEAQDALSEVEEQFPHGPTQVAAASSGLRVALMDIFGELLRLPPAKAYVGIRQLLWVLDQSSVDDLLNHETPADWWQRTGQSRFMCYNGAEAIRTRLKLPLRQDQRKAGTRSRQRIKREKQLKKT